MERVQLGGTGLKVSPIAFGAWELGGEWGEFRSDAASDAVRRARALGVNLFDTAQGYGFGASERFIGDALRHDLDHTRGEIVLATKGGLRSTPSGVVRDSSPTWLRQGVESSLAALGVDHIDLYQVHWPDPAVPFAETAGALQELVDEGKIRHVGVSNFDIAQISEFSATRPVETVQPPFNLFRQEAAQDLLPFCHAHDIGVLAYGPLAHGLLSGALDEQTTFAPGDWRAASPAFRGEPFARNLAAVDALREVAGDRGVSVSQLAIAWVLDNLAVEVAIIGTRDAAHVDSAVAAADLRLTAADRTHIETVMATAVPVGVPVPEVTP